MHSWVRNPKAPSSLWDGLVLDGAFAGLHPDTLRFQDGSGLENNANSVGAVEWVYDAHLGRLCNSNFSTSNYLLGPAFPLVVPFTVSCWIKSAQTTYASNAYFFSQYELPPRNWAIVLSTDGQFAIARAINADGTSGRLSVSNIFVTLNWMHVAVVWSGAAPTWSMYVNGINVHSGADGVWATAIARLSIGSLIGSNAFNGRIADCLKINRALSPAEIEWLANPSHRMYEPDTRRHFWFPQGGVKPWMIRRHRRMAGAR